MVGAESIGGKDSLGKFRSGLLWFVAGGCGGVGGATSPTSTPSRRAVLVLGLLCLLVCCSFGASASIVIPAGVNLGYGSGTYLVMPQTLEFDSVSRVDGVWVFDPAYSYGATLSKGSDVVLVGDIVSFSVVATRDSVAFTDCLFNVTKDGVLFQHNLAGGEVFSDVEVNAQGHTYTISGIYDTTLSIVDSAPVVSALDVVWMESSSGGGGGGYIISSPTPSLSPSVSDGGLPSPSPSGSSGVMPALDGGLLMFGAVAAVIVLAFVLLDGESKGNSRKPRKRRIEFGAQKRKRESYL